MSELVASLEASGISASIADRIDNITDRVLIITNYRPSDDRPPACFGIPLANYPDNLTIPNKCWCNFKTLKKINNLAPRLRPKYKEFSFEDRHFHPFSARLDEFTLTTESIVDLLAALYGHIDFNNND